MPSSRTLAIASVLSIATAFGAASSAQQPRIVNAQVATNPGGRALASTVGSLTASTTEVAWIGYTVPVADRDRTMCCWSSGDGYFSGSVASSTAPCCGSCRIEPEDKPLPREPTAASSTGPVKLEGPDRMLVLVRVANRQVDRVRTFSEDCEIDAGGRTVHLLENVTPADSVALLASMVRGEPDRKSRITTGALAALAQHADASAHVALASLAREHTAASVRGDALFWLGQMAGRKAAALITEAIEKDPETDVKRRAVFALSQLPRDEGVPLLIDVARKNANPAVRKQAMFWLSQSKDPRAIEFFAEILK
jgi:hypothetical protein